MEMAYEKFKSDFDATYNLPDIHPSLIKLCFYKGYVMGQKETYNKMVNELLPDSIKERL